MNATETGVLARAKRYKALAAWVALFAGALGLHRLYLHGWRNGLAWLHLLPTALGLLGVQRLTQLGQDDKLAWLLIPLLGLMLSQGALHAIVYGLMPDEKWDARHNPGQPTTPTRWAPVLAAMLALLLGGGVLMGTIAYSGQKFFEWQLDTPSSANGLGRHQLRAFLALLA